MPRSEGRKHRRPLFNGKSVNITLKSMWDGRHCAASFEKYNLPHSTIKDMCNCGLISLGLSLLIYKMRWLSVRISHFLDLKVPGPMIGGEI